MVATPISPTNPCSPVTTLLRRARRASVIKKTLISPNGTATESAVHSWTRNSGMGLGLSALGLIGYAFWSRSRT